MSSKTKPQPIKSTLQFTAILDEAAALQLDIETRAASLNERLSAIEIPEKAAIEQLKEQLNAKLVLAEAYALANTDELLTEGKKSAETARAAWGIRTTPPALKQISRAWTQARTIEALTEGMHLEFLSVKTTLDKEAIKSAMGNDPAGLRTFGLCIEQSEEFWMEPKRAVEVA